MDSKKEAKKYLKKYFKSQFINENDNEFKSLVRLLNKAQQQVKNTVGLGGVSGSLSSLQEWAKKEKDNQIEEIIVRTAFGNTIVVDLTSKSSIDEFCDFK